MTPSLHRGQHEAMNTSWQFYLHEAELEPSEAQQICQALGHELNQLEEQLSRFIPGSDISRINALRAGEQTPIQAAAWDCLQLARDFGQETSGLFDISTGPWIALYRESARRSSLPSPAQIEQLRPAIGPQSWSLEQHQGQLLAHCHHDQLMLDLGALGKGYALDQLAELLLHEHEIEHFLLCSGHSTLLARGSAPAENLPKAPSPESQQANSNGSQSSSGWPVNAGSQLLYLQDQALSTSGADEQGGHILHPKTGKPINIDKQTTHALAPQAAVADALSTSAYLMDKAQLQALLQRHPGLEVL